jgi:hypothetical protein
VPRKYSPAWWDSESRIDSDHYGTIARCVRFVEDQVTQFDDRNETEFSQEVAPLIQEALALPPSL